MNTLAKRSTETRLYEWDFSAQPEIADDGRTITSVVDRTQTPSSGASTVTLGGSTISGGRVQFSISGGTSGIRYLLTIRVQLSDGVTILSESGVLSVVDEVIPSV